MSANPRRWPRWLREVLLAVLVPIGVMIGLVLLLGLFTGAIPVNACTVENKRLDVSALDFWIRDEDCDAFLYKGGSTSVLVSRRGESDRTLLFKFTPVWWAPPPVVDVDEPKSKIVISVATVGSIYSQRSVWNDMTITYDIWNPSDPRLVDLRRRCRDLDRCGAR